MIGKIFTLVKVMMCSYNSQYGRLIKTVDRRTFRIGWACDVSVDLVTHYYSNYVAHRRGEILETLAP